MPPKKKKQQQRTHAVARRSRPVNEWTVGEVKEGLSTLWNTTRTIVSIFNTELKMFDVPLNPQLAAQTGAVFTLSLPATGDLYNQRSGLSIRPLKMDVNFELVWDTTTVAAQSSSFRVIIFRDFNCLGVSPQPADLLDVTDVNGLYNHVAADRFQILIDETQSGMTTRSRLPFRKHLNVEGHCLYRDATQTATALGNGNVFVCLITNVAANFPGVYGYTRLFYVDN